MDAQQSQPGWPSEAAANDAVRDQLRSMGDDGRSPRHVIQFAYASRPDADRDGAVALLQELGLEARARIDPNTLVFEHVREVASNDFDHFTGGLRQGLADFDWYYDGWECAVVSGGLS